MKARFEKDFRKWYYKSDHHRGAVTYAMFISFPDSMKWGVYQDFFEEHEISLYISPSRLRHGTFYSYQIHWPTSYCFGAPSKNRKEIMIAAIEAAIEVYNDIKQPTAKDEKIQQQNQ